VQDVISILQIEEGGLVAFESDVGRAEYYRIKRRDKEFKDYLAWKLKLKLKLKRRYDNGYWL